MDDSATSEATRARATPVWLGAIVSAAVAAVWSLIWGTVVVVGLYYVVESDDGGFGDELGDTIGVGLMIGGLIALAASFAIFTLARRVMRRGRASAGLVPLVLVDVIAAIATVWIVREAFPTAEGDGTAANPLYISLWAINAATAGLAAILLVIGGAREERSTGPSVGPLE